MHITLLKISGEEYEESGNSQMRGIQIVEFSKQLGKRILYQERQVYNEMVKNMYEGLTLSITVTYGDGTTEIVDVGFKTAEGSDDSGKGFRQSDCVCEMTVDRRAQDE